VTGHHDWSVEEQHVSDVDSGKAFLNCNPLHQLGDLQGELNGKVLLPVGAPHQGDFGNHFSCRGLADLGVVVSDTTAMTTLCTTQRG